jgi:hypothetical protein
MYLVRFCYDVSPSDRDAVIDLIRREVEGAEANNHQARLLVPLTRGATGAALEYELEIASLDALETFRDRAIDSDENATREWMRRFSDLLVAPPEVTVYRID